MMPEREIGFFAPKNLRIGSLRKELSMAVTGQTAISCEQYRGLQSTAVPPSSEELFEFERAMLFEKGLAPIEMFDRFAKRLPSGLFLPIPPQPAPVEELDWKDLMARVEWGGKAGQCHLNPLYLRDSVKAPSVPVMLVGVEDGYARLAIKPKDSRVNIANERRCAYTAWSWYIHVVLFREMLPRQQGYDIVGSSYCLDCVPGFHIGDGGLTLVSRREDYGLPGWGAPSYGSVKF